MVHLSLADGLQYGGYALELSLLVLLLSPTRIRRFPELCAYVFALFGVDALGRGWVHKHYGGGSSAYYYSYWLTDLLLAIGVFLLVCALFRRACREHPEFWAFVRPTLTIVLVMVILVSAAALGPNFRNLFTSSREGHRLYIYEFTQDLGFVCLVLNTALYLMLQRFKRRHGDLTLVVCGLGVQLAGPTASAALVYLAGNQGASRTIMSYVSPSCFLAMMVIWLYAIARRPSEAERIPSERRLPERDLVSQPVGLKSIAALRQNRRVAVGPNALQAGYLQPLRTRV